MAHLPPRIDDQITFRKLEMLLAFIDAGNLARAAERLDTSAVSVHRALRTLEEAMRCPLSVSYTHLTLPTICSV